MTEYTHKHHIIPKHAGGTNDPKNLVELTALDHAIAHKVLYGLWGRWQDNLAWKLLSGRIPSEEANRLASSIAVTEANKRRIHTKASKQKQSIAMKGKKCALGNKWNDHQRQICGNVWTGKIRPEHSQLMKSLGICPPNMRGKSWKQQQLVCPHCHEIGGAANMHRYHFDNCGKHQTNNQTGFIGITNGKTRKRVKVTTSLPEGFRKGWK